MKNNTKENILRAAIKIFASKGYKAATVREIGQEAGAANLSAVTYHFKGKENLYKSVLEFMFEDASRFIPKKIADTAQDIDPKESLRIFILTLMNIIYVIDSELDADLASIFSKEVTHPSPFLSEMVEKHMVPISEKLHKLLVEIIGEKAPCDVIRNCEDSIMGQIYYHLFAWPLIIRADPDHPAAHTQIDTIAHHIFLFTYGGLITIKKNIPEIPNE
jgi:TetR/AcrR family transcriptional regulator, regulator of cefoperazone and chloramphenicol sensitivity